MKQRTLKNQAVFEGTGLHTGRKVTVCVRPASENAGILFCRVDLAPDLKVKASIESVCSDEMRQTAILVGTGRVRTIEHLMASFHGLGIDNALVEIDGEEVPGMDGSALEFTKSMIAAGLEEQNAERQFLVVKTPVYIDQGDQSIVILPADSFSISYMLNYRDADLLDQYLSLPIMPEIFERELASARTFCLKKEAELLLSQGFGKGANPSNTLIFEKNKPLQNTLRFENEACRHKMMDILGDLFLCGKFIRGHVIASRSGHALNVELVRKLMMNTPP